MSVEGQANSGTASRAGAAAAARFDLLDATRGIAALAVMLYHYTNRTELQWMMGAWVAVDLFFILSGFVIALSYGRKLQQGMTFMQFVRVRMLRLVPLYLVGLLLGYAGMLLAAQSAGSTLAMSAATALSQASAHEAALLPFSAPISVSDANTALLLGLVWVPWFNGLAWPFDGHTITGAFYPLNDPSWSLAFEVIANVAFFHWVARRGTLSGASLVAAALGIFIAGSLIFRQFNPGFGEVNYVLGFPRVIGEFFLGTLIFQRGWHKRRYPMMLVVGVSLLAFALMVPEKRSFAIANSWLVIPLVVPLLASVQVRGAAWRRVCSMLGELSYPVYVLHVPVARLVHELLPMPGVSTAGRVVVSALIAVAVSAAFAQLDARLRRAINARSRPLSIPWPAPRPPRTVAAHSGLPQSPPQ